MVLDTANNPYIGYYNSIKQSIELAVKKDNRWQVESYKPDGMKMQGNPRMKLDQNGAVHLVDSQFTNSGLGLRHFQYDGSRWSSSLIEDGVNATIAGKAVAVDDSNAIHVVYVWHGNLSGVSSSVLRHARWTGSGWNLEDILTTTDYLGDLDMGLASDGTIHIVYDVSSTLHAGTWSNGGWQDSVLEANIGTNYSYASLALDQNDHPWIGYRTKDSLTQFSLRIKHWDGSSWISELFDSTSDPPSMKLAQDKQGNVYACYGFASEQNNRDVIYYANKQGNSWQKQVVYESSYQWPYSLGHASLALDSNQNPHVAFSRPWNSFDGLVLYASW